MTLPLCCRCLFGGLTDLYQLPVLNVLLFALLVFFFFFSFCSGLSASVYKATKPYFLFFLFLSSCLIFSLYGYIV